MELSNTWVNIDLDAIAANYLAIQEKAEGAQVCAVIKADAYGHGAVAVAKHLQTVGADFFAVSSVAEAVQLRQAGIDDPILLLGHTPTALYREVLEYGLRPAIFDENEEFNEDIESDDIKQNHVQDANPVVEALQSLSMNMVKTQAISGSSENEKRIVNIMIFYSDNSFESFVPHT